MSSADGGDERDGPPDVPARDRVRAAAGRVGDADLAVADRDDRQQDADGDADLQPVGERGHAAQDQDPQDLLGRVGRRADRVRAEDGQGLLLRQPLPELVLGGERPADEQPADRRRPPAGPGRRGAGGLLGGELARAGVAEVRGVRALEPDAPVAGFAALERPPSTDHRADLDTVREPGGEPGRQAAGRHRGLDRPDVVGDAMPGDGPGLGVEDEVAGPRIAVARLADAAGIGDGAQAVQREAVAGVRPERLDPVVAAGRRRAGCGCGRSARGSCRSRRTRPAPPPAR